MQGLGAKRQADGATRFHVWAPHAKSIELLVVEPPRGVFAMHAAGDGYFETRVADLPTGSNYFYRLNGSLDRPDPASRFQPFGIHGPSQVTDSMFAWTDQSWQGIAWSDYVIYEVHVGTFTREGTFDAVISHLDELAALGVTAVQLMPIAQFPGPRNWGYDGVHTYAAQNTYAGPAGFKRLVDACHARGLAVVLDVVYNHVGPEGNYLSEYGPYFNSRHQTPWGPAVNFDGPDSRGVRDYFIGNALGWLDEFHVDALRLDATHAIHDDSPVHLLAELAQAVHELGERTGWRRYLIAESNANDPRIVRSQESGGYGVDAQLVDDFHRSLYALTTGVRQGCYADFGTLADLAKGYSDGFVLTGRMSKYRGQKWGAQPEGISPERFVAFASCHDTVGNRPGGSRLASLVDFETWKLATSATLLSYCTPLVFMGDEYAETAPFHFFTSYLDRGLVERVRRGRQAEFAGYGWTSPFVDPQATATFKVSRLNHSRLHEGRHATAWQLHRELLTVRRELIKRARMTGHASRIDVLADRMVLVDRRAADVRVLFNFGERAVSVDASLVGAGQWHVRFHSADHCWEGPAESDSSATLNPDPLTLWPKSCLVLLID